MEICGFRGKNRWLSNFWPVKIEYEGIMYSSVEHAYQAAKTLDKDIRLAIAYLETPYDAKSYGKKIRTKRSDWDNVKIGIMKELLVKKFAHKELADRLIETGNMYLEETNNWGDRFWGVCGGIGENWLGKLLMEIRNGYQLRQS